MILLALVKVLLYRYTGRKTSWWAVRYPDGRARVGRPGGSLRQHVVLRDAVRGRVSSLLQRIRETALGRPHQAYPFDLLVEDVAAPGPGRNPLFDVMVSLARRGGRELRLPGIDVALPDRGRARASST